MHHRVGAETTAASSASSAVTRVVIDTPSFRIRGGCRRLSWQWHVLFGIVLFVAAFQFRLTRLTTSGSTSALATFASTTLASAVSAVAALTSVISTVVSTVVSTVISTVVSAGGTSIIATVITMITITVTAIVSIATSVISSGTTTAASAAIIARIIVIVPIVRFLSAGSDGTPLSSRTAMAQNGGNFDGMMIVLTVWKNASHDINSVALS